MGRLKGILRDFLYSKKFTRQICLWRIDIIEKLNIVYPILKQMILYPRAVFLVFTPEHGNLGDHAIASSEVELLVKNGIKYIEITGACLQKLSNMQRLSIMNKRTILINGGGILGTLWLNDEYLIRKIIQENPNSKIICLPNTIYYEDSELGKIELKKAIEIYNSHDNLKIYARERKSFDSMKNYFNNMELVPDMVLSLNKSDKYKYNRRGCLLCLRNDIEKTLSERQKNVIEQQVKAIFGQYVKYTDMYVDYRIPISKRENELEKKYEEFSKAELIITDRLHGMIFSAITGTPCILIDSKSPKIKGCYEWVKDLEYIQFANDITRIKEIYNNIPMKRYVYDNSKFLKWHNKLIEEVTRSNN